MENPISYNFTDEKSRENGISCGEMIMYEEVSILYLNPRVCSTEFLYELRPFVNHLDNLLSFHEREGDVRPRMKTHDLAEKMV